MSSTQDNLIGNLASRFANVRRLGAGAEGGTWIANDAGGRTVVLKHVSADRRGTVARAFEVLRAVSSPHLPAALELVEDPQTGGIWLVTQFVDGQVLAPGPAPLEQALAEALGVALALAAIHALGTHHGDVSANNVIVTGTHGVVLTDLGQLGSHGCGTPGFLAPEVLAGHGGPAADRFGVGCLLCLRLFGQVPWRSPERLLAVEGVDGVRRRIRSLADAAEVSLPAPLVSLLERLLDPTPSARVSDPELLVARLRQLHRASSTGELLRAQPAWWLPNRWSFIGARAELVEAARAIERGGARLVAVVGSAGSGRARVIEELIALLQLSRTRDPERGLTAQLTDADTLARELNREAGDSGGWLEAWVGSGRASATPRAWGLNHAPPWPATIASSIELQAAVLRAGVGLGQDQDALLLPVEPELGRLLVGASAEDPGILIVGVEPWTLAQVRRCLDGVVEQQFASHDELDRWARALHEATGGWPAKVVRAIEAFARAGGEDPDRAALERALIASDSEPRLDPQIARRVLDRRWGLPAELPASLCARGEPLASAVAAARVGLGDAVAALAEATLAQVRSLGGVVPLALALDADDADAVERCVLTVEPADQDRASELPSDLVDWLERGGALRVGPRLRLRALRELIRRGQAERALGLFEAIAATGTPSPAEGLEGVRALEQIGRPQDAIEAVDQLLPRTAGPDRDRALGLRWRALVDAGQIPRARAEAEAWAREIELAPSHPSNGAPNLAPNGAPNRTPNRAPSWRRAVAWLWGGLAVLYSGGEAGPWLDRALDECAGEHTGATARTVASLRARVYQLEANLAQVAGEGERARERYRAAADAFSRAGEGLGRVLAEGSLASLALDAGEYEEALTRGRRALRWFLARAQVQTLPAVCLNLVRTLVAVGALAEGRRLHELSRRVVMASAAHGGVSPLARARLWRAALELELGAPPAKREVHDVWRTELAGRLAECASSLCSAGATAESVDAHLSAAALLRVASRADAARARLDAARRVVLESGQDPALAPALALALESLAQAHDPDQLREASAELAALPSPTQLWASGERLLAWAYDRTLLGALHRHGSIGDPAAASVARRLLRYLEELMSKATPLDRRSLRQSLLSEAGEAGPLRELVRELEAIEHEVPEAALAPAARDELGPARGVDRRREHEGETVRLQQLLRLFRRLARHDSLERLLEQIVEAMMELTDAERGVVCVGQGEQRIEVVREFAAGGEGVSFSRSVIDRVLGSGEPVLSVDAASDDRFDGSRSISHLNLRSVLAVPLVFRGELLGAAYVDHRLRRGNFDATDLSHMEDFADLAAVAVAQARALAAVRTQAQELERQRAELAQLLERREVALVNLREEVRAGPKRRVYRGMVGSSKPMQRVFRLVDRLADSDVPVVIYGESGTGKELVARAIHDGGSRADKPFVAENCGAIPETLLESVLFGHVRGAFTGAQSSRPGLFEAADSGTIFLDEIGETSPAMQTKLLRVLQEGEVRRLGETKPRKVDVRVIAASNRDLAAMVESGAFRQDLFYRINVVKLDLPALRDRREDVPALVEHFLGRHRREAVEPLVVSASALRKLVRYPWPGNVRELENEVQRWLALCEERVMPDDLSPAIEGSGGAGEVEDPDDLELRPRVERLERELIARAMERTGNNQTQSAQLLGLSRYGLQKKLKRLEAD
ncbi:sigma 54-interacting transcriptional regulator [Enhygromyxa salina]|uniref:Transcriptional regulatory protein ZraR n=1 Tax=Enhygromyxa salina TaxID=215803 RepID=A0A2S9YW10_9BACT|nr:sigma 54-interacting transcriptional regulator [Enhygromyxa salina]PRQ09276.1 Transcriptional regulatory protein ZraR [Enhygromyxa salina]